MTAHAASTRTLSALVLVTTLLSVTLGLWWWRGIDPLEREAAMVGTALLELRSRQLRYFRDNHSYAPGPVALEAGRDGRWRYEVLAARWSGRPMMLIEAADGRRAMAIDAAGKVYQSRIEPFPSIRE